MKHLGYITNQSFRGMFVVLCDSKARFGGWDEYGDLLVEEDGAVLNLEGLSAIVDGGGYDHEGHLDVYVRDDGAIVLNNPVDAGVPAEGLATARSTESITVGTLDVPSGLLTIALAYPALNMVSHGDNAGVIHREQERLDIEVNAGRFTVFMERTEEGRFLSLRPT